MSKDRFKANPSDLTIVVVGPTGSGKTNFIKNLTGNVKRREAGQLRSGVQDITPYTIPRNDGRRIVLVDTPGFNDSYRPDSEILKKIANSLKQKYAPRNGILRLTGIIYIHRITDHRMSAGGSAYQNIQMFARLCGNIAPSRVYLVTTMWDIVDKDIAEGKEAEFKRDFWQELLQEGVTTFRFDNHPRSALTIIESLLEKKIGRNEFTPVTIMHRGRFRAHPSDLIIAVMGPTGSGKTNFINSVTGNTERRAASHLRSDTQDVTASCTISRDGGYRIVLVDTPGFDDTYRPDIDILKTIADWLIQEYSSGGGVLRLAGIIYLHRITDSRMCGSAYKNLSMFGRLCGDIPLPRVHLITTMWDIVKNRNMAERREAELKRDFWRPLLDGGAEAFRFNNRPGSAQAIIEPLLGMKNDREMLLLQEELVEQKKMRLRRAWF
ncbi:P-loop containing nucleoside triphosphate hydrolase protein [Chiua virens]|nr:P-loop containing nucleoside triphosphate hydrolase protein [Chiua virens]